MENQTIQHQVEHAQGSDPTFAPLPYEERWERLKPTIIRLYMEEKVERSVLCDILKTEYKLNAA